MTNYPITSIAPLCAPPPPDKTLGACGPCSGNAGSTSGGDPINLATGNLFESKQDYSTAGQNPLYFTRSYNSTASANGSFAGIMGNWRTNFDRYLHIIPASSPTTVIAERANGQMLQFTLSGGTWTPDTDVDYTLTHTGSGSGSTWKLTDHDDTAESYNDNGAGEGVLQNITLRNGYEQTLNYTSGQLTSVTDSYSRSLGFTYTSGLLTKVTTPDSPSTGIAYTYNSNNALYTVTYPTASVSGGTVLTYQYGNSSLPWALTGIQDQLGNQYATWNYNSAGQAIESYLGTSAMKANDTNISYNPGTCTAPCTTVTNALGVTDTYSYATHQNVPKVTQISRSVPSGTAPPAHSQSFSYDSYGFLSSASDWNGNQTQYTNNNNGNPTTIEEGIPNGSSTPTRTTTIAYGAATGACTTYVHLLCTITTPGVTTTFTYTGENLNTRVETDTTTGSTPYSTNGTARTWTYSWGTTGSGNIGLLVSVTGPLTTQTTSYTYSGGALASIIDAASHTTSITTTPGGLPINITDPNSM